MWFQAIFASLVLLMSITCKAERRILGKGTEPLPCKKILGDCKSMSKHLAFSGEHPWTIFMVKHVPNGIPFCGGTILTEQAVLTALHCFVDSVGTFNNDLDFEIIAGAHSFWIKDANWQQFRVYSLF